MIFWEDTRVLGQEPSICIRASYSEGTISKSLKKDGSTSPVSQSCGFA